jgi:hypothetical protein
MALRVRVQYDDPAASLGYSVERLSDGLLYDFADGTFRSVPASPISPLTAGSGSFARRYTATLTPTPTGQFPDGDYSVAIHDAGAGNAVVAELPDVMANGDDASLSPAAIAAAVFGYVTESTFTFLHVVRGWSAALMGRSTNGGSTFRDLADSKDRIVATVDSDFNRTSVAKDLG